MNNIILTKNQIWKIAELLEKHKMDQVKILVDHSTGIGPIMKVDFGPGAQKVDITDVSNW